MNAPQDEPVVKIVKAEILPTPGDEVEIALELRVEKLEAEEADEAKTTRQVLLSVVHLQDASLKHSVALGLFLAVLFFVASRALGA